MKKDKYFTFMIVPHDTGWKTVSLKIPAKLVYSVIGVFVAACFIFVGSLVYTSMLSRKLVYYGKAISTNQQQKKIIDSFSKKSEEVDQAIHELVKMDMELRQALGLKSWKGKIRLSSKIKSELSQAEVKQSSQGLNLADRQLVERKNSLIELKAWVNQVQERYASLPSRWPLSGQIVSRFGYRAFPWRGFHSGIDISGQYGAPVYCTADGLVEFTGWRQGYGKTVIVKHNSGLSTLYGHNSRFAVSVGQRVKKGQLVCYVGTTGWTTGPHLHYEVRRGDQPVNPIVYLDVNILSASRMLGRY